MLRPYRAILSRPGALSFSAAGLIARLPISMVGIGIVLMVSELYGSYGMAGRVAAVFVVVQALCAPRLAGLVDRYGQARVMRPALANASVGLIGLIVAAVVHAPEWVLYIAAVVGGSTIGSMGAMVRARWAPLVADARELHTAYSLESALDELTFVVGPVLATVLATTVTPWSALLVPLLGALVGGYWFLSQRATEPAPSPRVHGEPHSSVIRSGGMLAVAAVFLGTGGIFGGVDVSVVAFAEERGVKGLAGVVLGIFATGSLISGLLYGARHWLSALWLRFVIGVCVLALGVSMFVLVTSLPVLAAVGFVAGFAIAPTVINGNAIVQALVPASRLTEGLTWLGASIGIGVSAGSSLAGMAVAAAGSRGGFAVVAGAAAVAVLATLGGIPTLRRRTRTEPVIEPAPPVGPLDRLPDR